MERTKILYLVDLAAAVDFLALASTGLLIRYVLPAGQGHGRSTWLGWDRHDWGSFHFWLSAALIALVVLHVALHWSWVCGCTLRYLGCRPEPSRRGRDAAGALVAFALLLLVGGGLRMASGQVVQTHRGGIGARDSSAPAPRAPAHVDEEPAEHRLVGTSEIRGSMTFEEASRTLGVPVEELYDAVGLPRSTNPASRIGRTLRLRGMTPEDLRDAVREADDGGR